MKIIDLALIESINQNNFYNGNMPWSPTPRASVSSLVMVNSSVIFSFDGGAPSRVNLQRSERLDKARETFKGFLNITSTMIGSTKTETEGGGRCCVVVCETTAGPFSNSRL